MYERIILAYDGTREGRAALREGALLARKMDAEIYLMSVAPAGAGMQIGEAAYAGAIDKTQSIYRELFDEAIARLREWGLKPYGRLIEGEPVDEIAAYADEVQADLVVVGHRKRGMLDRWWSGTTNAYLADRLGCSILLGRKDVSDEVFFAAMAGNTSLPIAEDRSP